MTGIVVYLCLGVKYCTPRQEVNVCMLHVYVGYLESNAFCFLFRAVSKLYLCKFHGTPLLHC